MTLRLSVNLNVHHGHSMVKILRPSYQYICSKLISMTAIKSDKSSKPEYDLPTPVDPEVQFVNVPTKNLGVTSVDHIRASYTDENPTGSRVAFTIHGAPGKCLRLHVSLLYSMLVMVVNSRYLLLYFLAHCYDIRRGCFSVAVSINSINQDATVLV